METIETLGKYEIKRTLGRGAMGVVYEGWDPTIQRLVAVTQGAPQHGRVQPADQPAVTLRVEKHAGAIVGRGAECVRHDQPFVMRRKLLSPASTGPAIVRAATRPARSVR